MTQRAIIWLLLGICSGLILSRSKLELLPSFYTQRGRSRSSGQNLRAADMEMVSAQRIAMSDNCRIDARLKMRLLAADFDRNIMETMDAELARLRADIDSLRLGLDASKHVHLKDNEYHQAEVERLRAALEPFQRNIEALSLSAALGHIGREELQNARRAYEDHEG